MRIRIKHVSSPDKVDDFQDSKRQKLTLRLFRKNDAIARSRNALPPADPDSGLNRAGNLRGLHMRDEPPEEASARAKKIRAMRRFYNKKMPVMQCSGCSYAGSCPQYKSGYECAFLPFLNSHRVDSIDDLVNYMKELCAANMHRTHWMLTAETLSGAAPSLDTSEALNLAFTQLKQLYELVSKDDDTLEFETDDKGIIGELFGDMKSLLRSTKQAQTNPTSPLLLSSSKEADSDYLLEDSASKVDVNTNLASEFAREQVYARRGNRPDEELPEVTISESK